MQHRTASYNYQDVWNEYNEARKNRPPRELLTKAVGAGGRALDLGAGALNDTRYLLGKGYEVDAVDSNPSILELGKDFKAHLFVSTFDTFNFPTATYDLINASYALPFNPPETFDAMFARLIASLKPGGVFVGQFFGPKDSWSANKRMTFHTEEQVKNLFKGFTILHFKESKYEGKTALGQNKFWHVFDIIGRMSEKFFINTEAAIYKDGKWLVGIRSKNENEAPGLLSFVGGTVEHGDANTNTLESAVIREVDEEIGVKVRVLDFVNDTSFVSKKGNHVINVVFLCTIEFGEPKISDTEEVKELLWLTTEEILNYPNVPRWLCESIQKADRLKIL